MPDSFFLYSLAQMELKQKRIFVKTHAKQEHTICVINSFTRKKNIKFILSSTTHSQNHTERKIVKNTHQIQIVERKHSKLTD